MEHNGLDLPHKKTNKQTNKKQPTKQTSKTWNREASGWSIIHAIY